MKKYLMTLGLISIVSIAQANDSKKTQPPYEESLIYSCPLEAKNSEKYYITIAYKSNTNQNEIPTVSLVNQQDQGKAFKKSATIGEFVNSHKPTASEPHVLSVKIPFPRPDQFTFTAQVKTDENKSATLKCGILLQ